MNVRSENLASAASGVEDAAKGLQLTPELREAIEKLSQSLTEFRRGRNPDEEEFFVLAKEGYQNDGELEFDEDAIVSISGDGGAYVQGWVWIEQ